MTDVSRLPDGLEDAYAKFISMCGLLDHMANIHGQTKETALAGTFYSLMNLAESIRADFKAVIEGRPAAA